MSAARQLMQNESSDDTDDASEGEARTCCVERKDGFLREKFHHFWVPLGIGLLFEFLLVLAMWRWEILNWPELLKILEFRGMHEDKASELLRAGRCFPVVFVACILGRGLTMLAWKRSLFHGKDCHYSALFMFFNCIQWILYIALYFSLMDSLKMKISQRTLQSDIRFLPYNMTPPEHRYPCVDDPFWRDEDGMSCADYAVNTSKGSGGKIPCGIGRGEALSCPVSCNLTCQESPGLERFRRCVVRPGETLHSCATRGAQVAQWEACTMPYDPDKCFGYVFLLGEDQKNLVKCCVKMTFKSKLPADHLWQTSVKAFNLGIDDVFAMSKWIAVLVMTWNLQESPFLAPSHASKDFTNRVWLDILDSFMFISLFQDKAIQLPADGLTASGEPLPEGENRAKERVFMYTWLLGSICSVLSPIVYTWFRYRETKASPMEQKKQLLTQDTLLKELEERIRLLDQEGAQALLAKGMQLTEDDIAKQGELDTRVLVWPRDDSEGLSFFQAGDPGFAQREENQATYHVEYDHGELEEGVTLERLEPTEDQPRANQAQMCSGWCQTSYLCPDDDEMSGMQRCATLIDAYRSLLTLELPFFLWRLWLHWGDTSGVEPHLLTVKNFMFGLADLLTILACGNEDATVLGVAPAAIISRMIAGTVTGAVKAAGPGALMKRASGAALRAISSNQAKLEMKLAFLRQERYLARMRDGEDVARRFDSIIAKLTAEIEDEKGFLKHLHT